MMEPTDKQAIRAEYEAEFVPDEIEEQPSQAITKATEIRELSTLLGPSPRQVVQRIELAFRQKVHALDAEVAEMMEREVNLKETNRKTFEHNDALKKERDYWRDMQDPSGEQRALAEELAKTRQQLAAATKRLEAAAKIEAARPKAKRAKRKAKRGKS